MKENRRLVITAVVSNLIGKFGKKGLVTLISIILIRKLTVADFGVFNLFVSLIMMMGAFSFGVDKVFQRFYPMHLLERKDKAIQLLIVLVIVRYLVFAVLLLTASGISHLGLADPAGFNFSFVNLAVFVGFFFIGQLFLSIGLNNAYLEHKFVNTAYIIGDFSKVVCLILFLDSDIHKALMIWGAGEISVFILIVWRFFRRLRPNLRDMVMVKFSSLESKRYFEYVKYMILSSGATYILSAQADYYFISYYVDNSAVGFYAFASKIPFIMVLLSPSNLMFNIVSPLLFRKIDEGGKLSDIRFAMKIFLKLSVISWTILMGMTVVNLKLIITWIFDVKYLDTIPLICVWFLLLYVQVIKNVFEPVARAIEYTRIYLFTFIAAIGNIIGNLILTPDYGVNGTIISTGCSMMLQSAGISILVSRKMEMEIRASQILFYIIRISLLITLLFGCSHYLSSDFSEFVLSNVLVLSLICLMFWPKLCFSSEELKYIKGFLPLKVF